jgi:hypothetical protein
MIGEYEVQTGAGEIARYEVIDDGEYNRINLNGGDSNAYYHRKDDPTLLHNFKGEPFPYIKEILPQYYADLVRERNNQDATPNESGDILLAYRDKVTATYHKGTWNESTQTLELHAVKSRDQLQDFLLGHGRALGDFVPEWHTTFNPQSPTIVNEEEHIINLFVPGEYMQETNQKKGKYPAIQRILDSAVGTGPIQTHFLNWLAFIFQSKQKPLTAWILHGTEGTGKGMLIAKVIAPIFGHRYVHQMRASELNEKFNGYMETSLITFVDEIEASMFTNPKGAESDMRNYITEKSITIRKMRTDAYSVPNFTGFIFSSNKTQPVNVPMGDRRYNVGAFQATRFLPTEAEMESLPNELSHFAHFLQHYAVDAKAARTVLQTAEREAIQQLGVTSIDQLAHSLLNGNLSGLIAALPDTRLLAEMGVQNPTAMAYTGIIKRFIDDALQPDECRPKNTTLINQVTKEREPRNSKVTRDELAVIFTHCIGKVPEGAYKFSSFLRHHNIHIAPMRVGDEIIRGLRIDWQLTEEDRAQALGAFPTKAKLKTVR